MVGQSELVIEIQMDKNHTRGEGYASVFLFNVQVFVHLPLLQYICYFGLKFERTKNKNKISTPLSFVSSVPFAITETEIETRGVFRSN